MNKNKFRVWNGENYTSLSKAIHEGLVGVQHNRNDCFEIESYYENVILEQYIGMNDKNRVEIYEGDELEVYYSTPDGESHIMKVVVEEIDNFGLMLDLENSDSLEIIGNIHDEVKQ